MVNWENVLVASAALELAYIIEAQKSSPDFNKYWDARVPEAMEALMDLEPGYEIALAAENKDAEGLVSGSRKLLEEDVE